MKHRTVALTLILTAISVAAPAIVIRGDVPDARYLELGAKYRDTVVAFPWAAEDGRILVNGSTGTLIAPQWVITAGHVGALVKAGHPDNSAKTPDAVEIAGVSHPVEHVFMHPDASKGIARPGADVAMVKLAKPVEGGKEACLYPAQDEVGQVATIAGFGRTGTHLTGPRTKDGLLRAATATLAEHKFPSWAVHQRAGETLESTFHFPSDPQATPLEGTSGPGDSGGPAFLTHEGKLCVAGIMEASVSRGGKGDPYNGGGTIYVRVSAIRDWAMDVMNGKVAP
jgi:hypothetical protein